VAGQGHWQCCFWSPPTHHSRCTGWWPQHSDSSPSSEPAQSLSLRTLQISAPLIWRPSTPRSGCSGLCSQQGMQLLHGSGKKMLGGVAESPQTPWPVSVLV